MTEQERVLSDCDVVTNEPPTNCVDPETAKRDGRIAVEYQPSSGDGPQDWTPGTLSDELWDITVGDHTMSSSR